MRQIHGNIVGITGQILYFVRIKLLVILARIKLLVILALLDMVLYI